MATKDPILRTLTYDHNGQPLRLIAYGGLHKIGDQSPYFSLTGETYVKVKISGRMTWREDMAGCVHDVILAKFPELADLASLHLSNLDGMPLHAVENGAYWLGLSKWQAYDRDATARHFRISPEDANKLHDLVTGSPEPKATLRAWVNEQRSRWQDEADNCIKTHGLVVFGDEE